jgi:L-ascorbate metabolism protein UlaG (beta-lactamase superfamily)
MAQLTWWGHATTAIEVDGVRLLTDPVLRPRVGPLHNPGWVPPVLGRLDAVLVSHQHLDHLDLPSLRRLPPDVPVIVPPGAGQLARRAGARVKELGVGETVRVGAVTVRATRAVHPEGRWGRRPGPGSVGYWVEGTSSVYFAGDTAAFAEMRDLAGADLALLPVAGWGLTHGPGHMDAAEAAAAVALLRPGVVVPIHWGSLRIPALWRLRAGAVVGAGDAFRAHTHRVAPGVDVRLLTIGESLSFRRSVDVGG